jgi:hypothetical protein
MTPSARSRRHLAELGYHVATVEQTIPRCFIKRDCYGWADLLAVHPVKGIALVQVTSGPNLAARIHKASTVAGPLTAWILAGGKLLAHGWRKAGPRGARKTWQLREVELTLEHLKPQEASA